MAHARRVAARGARSADALALTADALRCELIAVMAELDHRRRRALDWRGQLRRHLGLVVGLTLTLALLGFVRWRRRRPRSRWR